MRILRRFWDALRDRDAAPAPQERPFAWLTVSVAGTIAGVAPLAGPMHDLLKDYPLADTLARVLVPAALLALCVAAVLSRQPTEARRQTGFRPAPSAAERAFEYSLSQPTRLAAKLFLLPLATLAVLSLARLRPAPRDQEIAGYLCAAGDRKPIGQGSVQLVNVVGANVSEPLPLESSGWFYFRQSGVQFRVEVLRLDSPLCKAKEPIRLQDALSDSEGCSADPNRGNYHAAHEHPWPTFYVACN